MSGNDKDDTLVVQENVGQTLEKELKKLEDTGVDCYLTGYVPFRNLDFFMKMWSNNKVARIVSIEVDGKFQHKYSLDDFVVPGSERYVLDGVRFGRRVFEEFRMRKAFHEIEGRGIDLQSLIEQCLKQNPVTLITGRKVLYDPSLFYLTKIIVAIPDPSTPGKEWHLPFTGRIAKDLLKKHTMQVREEMRSHGYKFATEKMPIILELKGVHMPDKLAYIHSRMPSGLFYERICAKEKVKALDERLVCKEIWRDSKQRVM